MAPPVIEAAYRFKAGLLASERQSATRLVKAYGRIYQGMQGQTQALLDQMLAMENPTRGQLQRMARMKTLQRQIVDEMTRYGTIIENEATLGAQEAIAQALGDSQKLTQLALPGVGALDAQIMAQWNRLHVDAVEQAIAFLGDGSPLQARWAVQMGEEVAKEVAEAMIQGVALGWNPVKIAGAIRTQYGQGLNWALRNAQTVQMWAYREASRMSYLANAHIVKDWTWVSALDNRTCLACIAEHGTIHPLSESLNDHYNGRCIAVPNTITYRDLGFDMDAEPLTVGSGEDWFKLQPELVQRQMMGPAKWDAWQAGKFNLDSLITLSPDPVYGEMVTEASLIGMLGDEAKVYYRNAA